MNTDWPQRSSQRFHPVMSSAVETSRPTPADAHVKPRSLDKLGMTALRPRAVSHRDTEPQSSDPQPQILPSVSPCLCER
jgi:hypothetical protein